MSVKKFHPAGAKLKLSGEIEIDESYFGAKRVRGKRGRGTLCKTPVFSFAPAGWDAKRDGKVYTVVVSNCSAKTLLPILKQFSELENSTIFSDSLTMDWLIMVQKNILE